MEPGSSAEGLTLDGSKDNSFITRVRRQSTGGWSLETQWGICEASLVALGLSLRYEYGRRGTGGLRREGIK